MGVVNLNRSTLVILTVFCLLMGLKLFLVLQQPLPEAWSGDAGDYFGKALYFHEHREFPRIQWDPSSVEALAYSDFRPPGYPLFIASFLPFGTTVPAIAQSLRLAHFGLDVATTLLLLAVVWRFHNDVAYRWIAAVVLGVQPWTTSFIVTLTPDTLTTFLLVLGVAFLALFATGQRAWVRNLGLLGGSCFLSLTFLVRPEMILFAFAVISFGLVLALPGGLSWRSIGRNGLLAAVPFLAIVGANMAYRWHIAQEVGIYGEFRHATPGLVQWTKTWIGSQTTKEPVIWGPLRIGPESFSELPDRAFSDDGERQSLTAAARSVAERGSMTVDEDRLFGAVARERIERDPLTYYVWNRLYCIGNFWINLSNSAHFLNAFSVLPRMLSKVLTLGFFTLKLMVLGFFVVGVVSFPYRNNHSTRALWSLSFIRMGILFVLLRTLYFGAYLAIPEYRYTLVAWPFVLAVALFGFAQTWEMTKRTKRIERCDHVKGSTGFAQTPAPHWNGRARRGLTARATSTRFRSVTPVTRP
jgi:hypothetical protein